MPTHKTDRTSQDIKRVLSSLISGLKDPRVKDKMLSITKVDLSNDLSHAKIYISDLNGADSAEEAVQGLISATGFLKRELMGVLDMRKCPELKFIADDSIEHSAKINKMIDDFNK